MAITDKIENLKSRRAKTDTAFTGLTCETVEEYIDKNVMSTLDIKDFLKKLSLAILCEKEIL